MPIRLPLTRLAYGLEELRIFSGPEAPQPTGPDGTGAKPPPLRCVKEQRVLVLVGENLGSLQKQVALIFRSSCGDGLNPMTVDAAAIMTGGENLMRVW